MTPNLAVRLLNKEMYAIYFVTILASFQLIYWARLIRKQNKTLDDLSKTKNFYKKGLLSSGILNILQGVIFILPFGKIKSSKKRRKKKKYIRKPYYY